MNESKLNLKWQCLRGELWNRNVNEKCEACGRGLIMDGKPLALGYYFDEKGVCYCHACITGARREEKNDGKNRTPGAAFIESMETLQTGGYVMVDLITLKDGRVIGISDELLCLYKSREAFETGDCDWQKDCLELFDLREMDNV